MSTPSQLRKVKVWRPSVKLDSQRRPVFKGDWFLGEDWRKESWPTDVAIECREIYFSLVWRTSIITKGRIKICSRQLWTMKSRREARVFYGYNGHQFDDQYTYDEEAHDDEFEPVTES